jgi:hypothetical protein
LLLRIGILQARALARWLDAAQPELVVVGNSGWERDLLLQCRARGVPTVLLQHGTFGDFYQLMDEPVDAIVARGRFFRDFLSQASRRKSTVLNIPEPQPQLPVDRPGRDILFLTAPYIFSSNDPRERGDIYLALLRVAARLGRTIIVRVHPLEDLRQRRREINALNRTLNPQARLEFSQGPGLSDVLDRSAVAVTYASTAFLDCLRRGIPIVSFGWCDFSYKRAIQQLGVFHFAHTLAELEQLVEQGLSGALPARSEMLPEFLAPTTSDELRHWFGDVMARRAGGNP